MRDCDKQSERPRRWTVSWVQYALTGMIVVSLVSASSAAWAETPGERFRKVMEREAEYCATHKIKPTNRRCDITKLQPADPLTTEEGRFAHSIKIPNPVPEDSGYKPGMTPQEYFNHLCKTEAGEFIYKTVENVEGLYMMRPRKEATDDELQHLYALEDPYGHTNGEATMGEYDFVTPNRYGYLERSIQPSKFIQGFKQSSEGSTYRPTNYERFSGYDARNLNSMHKQSIEGLKSRYGFTWRGISRSYDRELGVAGGELIVLDLQTYEVLGVRRGYIRSGGVRNNLTGIWWLTGQACPTYGYRNGRNKDFDFSYWFIGKVLKPMNYEQSFKELTNAK
jgi:hypothetical protein